MASLGSITLVVDNYDKAIAYFTHTLGFALIEDTDMGAGKRWVVIAPQSGSGATLLIAQASNDEQRKAIGNQTGGRVAFFLYTDDFAVDYAGMKERGVEFIEEPRSETFGNVVVFRDIYGNKWDFIGRNS